MRRAAIVGAACLFLWAGVAPDATACDCVAAGTACFAARSANAVFVGRVTAFTGDVQFEVERAFVGVRPGKITLENGPGNCSLPFTIGDRYVVYAYRDRSSGALVTNKCSRTRPLSDQRTRADVAYFTRRQHGGADRTLVTGVVRDVTIDLVAPSAVGRPLAGIRITAVPLDGGARRTATTRADGSYELSRVRAGQLSITASLPAQFQPHQAVTVTLDDKRSCAEVDVGARIDGRISGQLLDERNQPLRRVDVQLVDAAAARAVKSPLRTIDAVTDEYGNFEFQTVGPGRYVVGVDLRTPLRSGTLNRRRFYGASLSSLSPAAALVVELAAGERRQLPPVRLPPLPAERVITVVVQAPTSEVALGVTLVLTGASREPVEPTSLPLTLRLPYGASYVIEAAAPPGYRVRQPNTVRIARDDVDRTIEFRVERGEATRR